MTVAGGMAPPSAEAAAPGALLDALDRRARTTPSSPAVRAIDQDGRVTRVHCYGELAEEVAGLAVTVSTFASRGETVLLACPPSARFVAWFLACLRAGARVFVLNPRSTAHEVRQAAERTGARALVAAGPAPAGVRHAPVDCDARPTAGAARPPEDAGSLLLQSSGTTGLPKIVRRTAASLDADGRNVAAAAALSPRDRILAAVPLSHSYGIDLIAAAIVSGAALDVFDGFSARAVQAHLTHGGPTVFPGVPFMFEALARGAGAARPPTLRLAFSAGTPLPVRIAHDVQRAWGLAPGQLYGSSELGSVTLGTPDHPEFDPLSVGRPMRGVAVRVLDPGDPSRPRPAGAEGELAVRAPSMFAEYVGEQSPLVDGHFRTGDLGRVDEHGRVYITGRIKHLIDVGGLKVNPLEVEQAMSEHPAVAECAVVPLPLSDTVNRLRLVYVPRAGVDAGETDLRAFARERLAPHKVPRSFEPAAALPRSPSGKLLRHLLVSA